MSPFPVFVNFLEDYNRYRAENFSLYLTFNGLSNDISHFVLAQKFIISTCLRYVDITDFCQFCRRLCEHILGKNIARVVLHLSETEKKSPHTNDVYKF